MLREQTFSDMRRYQEISETSTPVDAVEWFAKNKGITNLDDPKVKVHTIIDDVNESELARYEAKKAREAKAQDDFLDAMFNLDNGTAVLRQKSDKNEVLKKARAIKKAEPKVVKKAVEVAKPAKNIANVAKKTIKPSKPAKYVPKPKKLGFKLRQSAKQVTPLQITRLQKALAIKNRRDAMIETLRSGGAVKPLDWRNRNLRGHQIQSNDLAVIEEKEGFSIVRVHQMNTRTLGFMIDDFERYDMQGVISCYLGSSSKKKLLEAVCSGKLVTVESFIEGVPACRRVMTTLSRKYGFDIHSVMRRNKTLGWILIEDKVDAGKPIKNEADISDLGDMLDALDYLKVRKEVAERMPGATPNEILEAAYREFKRVAKDAGSTVSEVLAVKEGR